MASEKQRKQRAKFKAAAKKCKGGSRTAYRACMKSELRKRE